MYTRMGGNGNPEKCKLKQAERNGHAFHTTVGTSPHHHK
jgi:hypothetical protein